MRIGRGNDLDRLTGFQLRAERHQMPADTGSDTVVTDIGMHCGGKIDGSGAARQGQDFAFGVET